MQTVNRYHAKLIVKNVVSEERYVWIHQVTRGWCYPPGNLDQMAITNKCVVSDTICFGTMKPDSCRINFPRTLCHVSSKHDVRQGRRCATGRLEGFKMVRRSQQLDVLSNVRLNCTSSNIVLYTFNVSTLTDNGEQLSQLVW